jgi:hypothetical protein
METNPTPFQTHTIAHPPQKWPPSCRAILCLKITYSWSVALKPQGTVVVVVVVEVESVVAVEVESVVMVDVKVDVGVVVQPVPFHNGL